MGRAAATPLGPEHFRHAGRHDHRFPHSFVVAPNFIATETNRSESASCAAVGNLRFHGRALFAPHTPISSLLHNVWKHANLDGGWGSLMRTRLRSLSPPTSVFKPLTKIRLFLYAPLFSTFFFSSLFPS